MMSSAIRSSGRWRGELARAELREIGRRLALTRRMRGMKLDSVADSAGCCAATVSNVERGLRGGQLLTVVGIADALGVSLDDLVVGLVDVRDPLMRALWEVRCS